MSEQIYSWKSGDSSSIGGYVCPYCGVWVPWGENHSCDGTITYNYTYPCCICSTQLQQQLLDKIDKLLNLVEKLMEKKK